MNHFKPMLSLDLYNGQGSLELLNILPQVFSVEQHYEDMSPDEKHWLSAADRQIVASARVSYGNELKGHEKDFKLLKYLWENQHMGPFEQVQYQFRLKAPMMSVIHLIRHRTGKYNWQSYRYTEIEDEFYIPEQWRTQDSVNKQGSLDITINGEGFEEGMYYMCNHAFQNLLAQLEYENAPKSDNPISQILEQWIFASMELYQLALDNGIAKEQARLFIPSYGLMSEGIITFDLRNLIHFIELRADSHAQWETQQIAIAMKKMVRFMNPAVSTIIGWDN